MCFVCDPTESFPAFIQLFSFYWDEIMDFHMGQNEKLAGRMFMSNVNPQIPILCRVVG